MTLILPFPPPSYDAAYMRDLVRQIEDADSANVKAAPNKRVYAESNVTLTREFDADDAASAADLAALKLVVAELADVVGTLVKDLREKGVVG